MSERDKMRVGLAYNTRDPELLAAYHRARRLNAAYHAVPSGDAEARAEALRAFLPHAGAGVWIEPPVYCTYGDGLTIGVETFVNVNAVFLDDGPIRIGARGLIGPGVHVYTATHPAAARDRMLPPAERPAGHGPYRTVARGVTIGDDVWIGGGTLVMPGVTIGDRVTIGAGSVVTRDVPSDVLAFGNPCRVIRPL